jgi:dTMP kinase
VVDRYSYSGAAFSAAKGLSASFAFHSELGLPAPDVTIFLSISPEDAASRGGYGDERYENRDMQEKVRTQFRQLMERERGKGRMWVEVEAGKGRTVDEVAAEIERIAEEAIDRISSHSIPIQHFT